MDTQEIATVIRFHGHFYPAGKPKAINALVD